MKMKNKYNLIYRVRRKGYVVITRGRTIEVDYRMPVSEAMKVRQIRRLIEEYNFYIQFIIR